MWLCRARPAGAAFPGSLLHDAPRQRQEEEEQRGQATQLDWDR